MYAAIRQSNIYNNFSTFGIIMYIFKHIFVIDVLHFVFPLECPLTKKKPQLVLLKFIHPNLRFNEKHLLSTYLQLTSANSQLYIIMFLMK